MNNASVSSGGKSNTKKIVGILGLSIIIILCLVLVPYFLGFARTGFENENIFRQYMVYAYFGGIMLFGILMIAFIEILVKEKDKLYGDGIGFVNQGEYPSLKFFGKFSTLQIALASLLIIVSLAFMNFLTVKQSFFQIATTAQQFTPTDSLVFRTFLVPLSENLGLAFLLAVFIFGLRWWCRKKNISKENFWIFALVGVIFLSGGYGFGLHQLVYGGQETDLLRVIGIWTIGGLVTFFTGSFVVFWVLHLINNFFIDLKSFFPNETMLVIFVLIFISLLVLYWFLYIRNKKANYSKTFKGLKNFKLQ